MSYPAWMTLILPLPNPVLSPNGRCNWRRKALAVKAARKLTRDECLLRRSSSLDDEYNYAWINARFYWPCHRRRDMANAVARLKPYIDGLVDAGAIVDDDSEHLGDIRCVFEHDAARPRVEITIMRSKKKVNP